MDDAHAGEIRENVTKNYLIRSRGPFPSRTPAGKLQRALRGVRHFALVQFDFRYSVLPVVFGNLIREGRLTEEELLGLAEEKLSYIR